MRLGGHFRAQAGRRRTRGQQGYLLLVILLLLALLMISLVAVAPRIAQQIKRDREEETIHRGTQYVRAIRLFYRKFGRYPTSLKELESTNNLRFLRKQYKDPLSPNGQWRIIHLGEVKVTPTGFGAQGASGGAAPGQPGLLGQPGASPGGAAGTIGQPASMGSMSGLGQPTAPSAGQEGSSSSGQEGSSSSSSSSSPPGSSSSSGSTTSSTLGGGAIVGVAPLNNGASIKELNGKSHYNEWEFVYDPRLDLSNRQGVPGVVPGGGAPGSPQPGQTGPGTQPSSSPMVPPMGPR